MEHLVYQIQEDACALACFQMILMNETGKKDYRFARLESHPPHSLEDLEKGARRYGYTLSFYEAERKEIDYPWNKKQGFLAIKNDKNDGHMVYVKKITKRNVVYLDPAVGKMKCSKKEFEDDWSGVFGILQVNKNSKLPTKEKLLPFYETLALYLFPILSTLSLLCGFYFFSDEGNILLPALSFLAFGVFSIVQHLLSLKVNSRLDEKYLERLDYSNSERMMKTYEEYHCYKRYKLMNFPNMVNELVGVLTLITLVSMNNPFFLLPIFITLFAYLLMRCISFRKLSKEKKNIEGLENGLRHSSNQEELRGTLRRIGILSSSFALKIEYGRIVICVLALASNLLSLLGCQEVTLNFYLFHLFSLLAVLLLFQHCVAVFFSYKDYDIAQGNFIEYLSKKE